MISPSIVSYKPLISCPLSSLSHEPPIEDAVKLACPFKYKPMFVKLWDSCNGLFCIEITGREDGFLLWIPSTRESKTLPFYPYKIEIFPGLGSAEESNVALGFDLLNNDYKVLRVPQIYTSLEQNFEANMYSLNANSWTKIDDFPASSFSFTSACKYLNGAFHWVAIVSTVNIISLNLSTERFGEVPLPNYAIMQNPEKAVEVDLAVLRGMLCVYCYHAKQSFVLWAMKDYGHQESWEKMFDIDMPPTMLRLYFHFVPMYLCENGEILLIAYTDEGDDPVIYNKNSFGFKKVVGRGLSRVDQAKVYVESLISPLRK